MKIGIIGLGYVGLPLSIVFANAGIEVLGFDVDSNKVDRLNKGESYIKHIASSSILELIDNESFKATSDFHEISNVEAAIICVPTPLNGHREPDLSYVLDTARRIGQNLSKETLVVLESTTYPGTTEGELREMLETTSGLKAGKDFYLAYSPEREDPGNPDSKVKKIPKVVGGYTDKCLAKVTELYSKAIETLVPVPDCKTAEATKLTENIFRSVNIALVNELKIVYEKMGIDVWEVIEAAKTKPFGYMPFYPGPGLGGHCIPIDPFYLTWKAREYGMHTRFIELAGEVNTSMPDYVIQKVSEALNDEGKPLRGSKILILGIAYKSNVDDDRESPSYVLMEDLESKGSDVSYSDPYVPEIKPSREYTKYAGRRSVEVTDHYDLILVLTAHDEFKNIDFSKYKCPIVDTRNCIKVKPIKYVKA